LPLDWSPDGKTILFYQVGGATTGRDLMLAHLASKPTEPTPYLQTPFNEWWARFIPIVPTNWIAYQSDESGQWEVYVDSYPIPGRRRRISTGGGQFPEWSANGRELFFVSPDYRLMSTPIAVRADTVESS